jgi:Flp pilus assembly protein TadD
MKKHLFLALTVSTFGLIVTQPAAAQNLVASVVAASDLSDATTDNTRRSERANKKRRKAEMPLELAALSRDELLDAGTSALVSGQDDVAIAPLAELVSRQPQSGKSQTLLGLAYHLAADRNPERIELALAGYDLAMRAEPGLYWPAALAGRAAYDQNRFGDALNYFSRALLLRPGDVRLLGAVAASAYMSGDIVLADLAASKALTQSPDANPEIIRLAALAVAANGRSADATALANQLAQEFPALEASLENRLLQIAQTNMLDDEDSTASEGLADGGFAAAPDQISVDVAIVLSQNTQRERTGFNLLDGLQLQYGGNRTSTRQFDQPAGGPGSSNYQRVITASISVPQLNYNLNLFNRGGQFYSVVARPQLTAFRGEESEFFIGRSLRVAVGGVNTSSLEQIDIGIEMKVTPIEITATGTKVRIETGRSFLTADPAGSFNEALTMFRQKVVATAEVRFGETLLLSGLSETVDDKTYSKTPILGDIPLIGNAFNERNRVQRKDSVIILVTPARPIALPGRPWARADHVARLAELWTKVIDPASDAAATVERLSHARMFSRQTRADVTMPFPDARAAADEILAEIAIR